MRSVNKVVLMGYLATDPEYKIIPSGATLTKFKLATNRDWSSSDGEKHEATDFHKVVTWNKLADICRDYLKKGSSIYLEGRIMNRNYKTQEGDSRQLTEIVADEVNFISFKKSEASEEVQLIDLAA